jgi:hypothetical protein
MNEEPSFSTKPINEPGTEKKPKKVVRKKTARKKESLEEYVEEKKQTKISKQLAEIYQDDQGRMPDMRQIKITKTHTAFKTFLTIVLIGGLLAAVAWAGLFFIPGGADKFSEDKVALRLNGPTNIMAGTTTTYKVAYENNQSVAFKKAIINVQYPDGFVFVSSDVAPKNSGHTEWDLGKVEAGKKREINITGLTYGALNQKQSWRVFLTYQPENFGSELQKSAILDIVTDKSPFSLTVNGSNKTLAGNAVDYTLVVHKEADSAIAKLELRPSWPKNFILVSSSPAIGKDFKWILEPNKFSSPSSFADTSWTFKLSGRFDTSTEETNEITGALLTLANNKLFTITDTKIAPQVGKSDLDLSLAINGSIGNLSAQPGKQLNMTLTLKNSSDQDIDNGVLKLGLNGPSIQKQALLNWAKIEDKYDGNIVGSQISANVRRGEITWDKSKIPALAKLKKGQEISIDIVLPLKDAAAINLSDLKDSFKITALAELAFKDSDKKDQKISSNQIVITVNSDLKFEARDTISGQQHKINWVVTNNFHPLKNLTLSADVIGDVSVELPAPTPAGGVKFDAKTTKLTWTIAEMPDSVDVLALPITITINTPNTTQELLVSKVNIQADDTVTGEKIDLVGDELKLK